MFRSHDTTGHVEEADDGGDTAVCIHVVPLHDGWTEDETIAWLGQGLELPDVEPHEWLTVSWCPADACEICRY